MLHYRQEGNFTYESHYVSVTLNERKSGTGSDCTGDCVVQVSRQINVLKLGSLDTACLHSMCLPLTLNTFTSISTRDVTILEMQK